jgi:hypothetical protein
MKTLALLLFTCTLFLASCGTEKAVVENSKQEVKKGTIIQLAKRTANGLLDEKEYYFRFNEQNYFIKLSESAVTTKDLSKRLDKDVCLLGEIISGPWEAEKPATISTPHGAEKAREGLYIAIDAFIKCP